MIMVIPFVGLGARPRCASRRGIRKDSSPATSFPAFPATPVCVRQCGAWVASRPKTRATRDPFASGQDSSGALRRRGRPAPLRGSLRVRRASGRACPITLLKPGLSRPSPAFATRASAGFPASVYRRAHDRHEVGAANRSNDRRPPCRRQPSARHDAPARSRAPPAPWSCSPSCSASAPTSTRTGWARSRTEFNCERAKLHLKIPQAVGRLRVALNESFGRASRERAERTRQRNESAASQRRAPTPSPSPSPNWVLGLGQER